MNKLQNNNKKKRVFITRSILKDGIDLLREQGYIVTVSEFDRPLTPRELLEKSKDADALITMLSDKLDSAFFAQNPHLKVISNYAVGFNNIDIATATNLKIPVGNTPDVLTEATAEVALGLMISMTRSFHKANQDASIGLWNDWHPTKYLGHGLQGKTLGIIGFGRIGQRLAKMCQQAFSMHVLYTANSPKDELLKAHRVELNELLAKSDFVSIHAPLNEKTRHLLGKNEFNTMKKSAILVNTARGEIINQKELISALKEKIIFGAGLDVTDPEPLDPQNELFKLENALVLPHIGSATYEARRDMSIVCAKNIIAGLEGRPLFAMVNAPTP